MSTFPLIILTYHLILPRVMACHAIVTSIALCVKINHYGSMGGGHYTAFVHEGGVSSCPVIYCYLLIMRNLAYIPYIYHNLWKKKFEILSVLTLVVIYMIRALVYVLRLLLCETHRTLTSICWACHVHP